MSSPEVENSDVLGGVPCRHLEVMNSGVVGFLVSSGTTVSTFYDDKNKHLDSFCPCRQGQSVREGCMTHATKIIQ